MASGSLQSCTEVIELDLEDTQPRLVIEGAIDDQGGSYAVKISETLNFDAPNSWPMVSGAQVIMSEEGGLSDTLQESSAGMYTGHRLRGVPGRAYRLQVWVDGVLHSARSVMPLPVALDTTYVQLSAVQGGQELTPVVVFDDPAGQPNFYFFSVNRNGAQLPGFFTLNDELRDGGRVTRPLRSAGLNIERGDTLRVEMQCVDPAVYAYFYVLGQAAGQGLSASPTPANPTGNFDTGALGYFSAHTASAQTIVVE